MYKSWRLKAFFNLKPSQMFWLGISDSFEYLCYGSTAIINVLLFQCGINFRRQHLTSIYRCQNLMSMQMKVDPRNERVKDTLLRTLEALVWLVCPAVVLGGRHGACATSFIASPGTWSRQSLYQKNSPLPRNKKLDWLIVKRQTLALFFWHGVMPSEVCRGENVVKSWSQCV